MDGFTFLLTKCSMDMVTRSLKNRLVEGCMVWVPRLREGPSECIKSSAPLDLLYPQVGTVTNYAGAAWPPTRGTLDPDGLTMCNILSLLKN